MLKQDCNAIIDTQFDALRLYRSFSQLENVSSTQLRRPATDGSQPDLGTVTRQDCSGADPRRSTFEASAGAKHTHSSSSSSAGQARRLFRLDVCGCPAIAFAGLLTDSRVRPVNAVKNMARHANANAQIGQQTPISSSICKPWRLQSSQVSSHGSESQTV